MHTNKICNISPKMLTLGAMLVSSMAVQAQIKSVHGTVSDDFGPLMGATVCEIDGSGRIIESAITDMNGNFTMKVRNDKNRLRISFVGLKTQTLKFDKTTYDIKMESATTLQEVTVKSKRRAMGNSLPIPERELSQARQSLNAKEFEGLGLTSVDEALQGRIAGLDIVANSGNLGAGSTMKLRNSGSLSGLTNESPLIVVDGNVRNDLDMSTFDAASANEEKFSELLNVNTDDIASITVIKDGAGAAIYGSQGANGVIEITTKRGAKGKPKLSYSFKLTGKYQPKGMNLLSGDDYTMLLKESYFNPQQNDAASNIPEINYLGIQNWREANQYDDNTDWRDAVTQWGMLQNHYLTISGGGEKALFRISGGFDTETGSVIAQKLNRFSTRVNLDYNVSERIRVQTNFAMTYTKNDRNSDDLLAIAQKKMPNMSIYEEDLNGNDTQTYYNMLQSGDYIGSEVFKDDQRKYVNPVASAYLAKNALTTYDLNPELVLNYDLLGLDEDHHRLTWRGQVYMRIANYYTDTYRPGVLASTSWRDYNSSSYESKKDVSLTTKHTLTFIPSFNNKDHSLMAMGRMELSTWNSNGQRTASYRLPAGVESPFGGGLNNGLSSWYSEGRSLYFTLSTHYAYKGRYIADATLRADGTTKFGPDNRWGYFPSVSLRWNVVDEPWMEPARKWLSMLSIRPSWAYTGVAPSSEYLFTSKYAAGSQYLDMTSMYPTNLKLTNLKWQKSNKFNVGFDLGFWNDRVTLSFEMYNETITDLLMRNFRIPSNTGFATVDYRNDGKMRNTGWEFFINTNKLIRKGKFYVDVNANFSNSKSRILEMDPTLLDAKNTTYQYVNNLIMERVQLNNPNNSIYGLKYKGVYQYNYNTFADLSIEEQDAWIAEGKTAPVALNAEGKVIRDDSGAPIRMMYGYSNDGSGVNSGNGYRFAGGDAMYEDVNHDGQINALDIVYLGSSLPKLVGGFGFSFNYGDWRLSTQFSYRVGFKIINRARLTAEAMINNDNQSQAVNYRWRKEGDVTSIPRAMYGSETNYNTLMSDRFVEDGSYLRMTYAQLSYAVKKKYLKNLGLSRLSFYVSANNPFIFTKYTGVDPDISASGTSPAIDYGQTPRAKSYTLGMTVDF